MNNALPEELIPDNADHGDEQQHQGPTEAEVRASVPAGCRRKSSRETRKVAPCRTVE